MAQRPAHDLLERQPWAASSRNAVIDRCNRIINGDFIADKDILPRSGPWKHRLVDPHKALRKTTGRAVHPDSWRVGFVESKKKEYYSMPREEWDAWHARHAVKWRSLPGGQTEQSIEWRVPGHIVKGNTYLPMGTIDNISRSSSLSSVIAKTAAQRADSSAAHGILAFTKDQVSAPFRGQGESRT